jgi:hypothetical protein
MRGWDRVKVKSAIAVQQNQRHDNWRQIIDCTMVPTQKAVDVADPAGEIRRICGARHQIANNLRQPPHREIP